MSLSRIALRIAAVEAIKGRTLVGERVLDTPNGALDVQADGSLRTSEDRPFVAVFTDQAKAESISGRGLLENGFCDIVFEIGMSSAMTELNTQTGETRLVGISVPASDRNIEFYLDVVQRQVFDALTDPDNAWAEIYRGLHYRVVKTEFIGARNNDDGQRLAGRQVRVTVELADDPLRGQPLDPESAFALFLGALDAAAEVDGEYAEQVATMRLVLGGDEEPWKALQRRRGMTAAEIDSLGLPAEGPVQSAGQGELTIEIEGMPSVTEVGP